MTRIDRLEGVHPTRAVEATPKKKPKPKLPESSPPTLDDWLDALPDSAALKKDLERIKNRRNKKKVPDNVGGLPAASTPGRSVVTGEIKDRAGRVKPHRHRQD